MTRRKPDVRLTPSRALRVILGKLCAMTGASVEECLIRRRGSTVDTARNLALHFLVEVERYQVTKLALAFPPNAKTGKPRHHTSPKHNMIRGWELREATRPYSDELFDWLKLHWRDPISAHRSQFAKRARAFQAAIAAAEQARGVRRLEAPDLADAVTAMIRAKPFMVAPPNAAAHRRAPVATAVPLVDDEPDAVAVLRRAPAVTAFKPQIRYEPSREGGVAIELFTTDVSVATKALLAAAKTLLYCGFKSEQRRGLRGTYLHVMAPALAALIAAIHVAQPARILSPIDGAPNGSHGPALTTV